MNRERRSFLIAATAAGFSGAACNSALWAAPAVGAAAQGKPAEDVSPAEDLMREHGVLKRVLMVYDEVARRLHAKQEVPPQPVLDAADIIRTFIEDYHEKLEEEFLFPRFKKAGKLVELVDVLLAQHAAGRKLTERIRRLASAESMKSENDRRKLRHALERFVRMYGPHEAREDTVLFPALHTIVTANEYDSLGEEFEKREHERFGQDGFEKAVDRVASIEKVLGIYDLAQFTPRD